MQAAVVFATTAGALVFALPSGAAPAAGNDTCGYPTASFTESTVMRWGQVNGTGLSAQIVGFANDEKGLLLGVNGATADASSPDHVSNASGGSATAVDPSNRPFFPALYITDVTTAASPTQYDFQNGGTPRNLNGAGNPFVDDVFGTWSTATATEDPVTHQVSNYSVTAPPAKNDWNLGPGSDSPNGTTFAAMGTEGYGAEVRWNVNNLTDGAGNSLQPGDTYRVQILTHDGDQNKAGGDAGEFCVTLTIPKQPSSMTTSATDQSGSPGTVGDTIKDTATVTGAHPTGTVTFQLYSDANCTTLVHSETDSLSGGQATTATGFKTTAPGTYYWVDTYSGDSHNSASGPYPGAPGTAACSSDPKEQSTVAVAPAPDMTVLKLASVHCSDLAAGISQPLGLTPSSCASKYGTWSPFSHGTWTLTVPPTGQSYAIPIDYQIRVQNTGNTPLQLSLSDPRCDSGTISGPVAVSGQLVGNTLSAGGAAYFTCSHTLTQNDPDLNAQGQPFTNTATVSGTVPGGPTLHRSSQVTVDRRPQVLPFCRAKRGPHKGQKIHYRRGHFPKACLKPRPPSKPPKKPSGFTG